MRIVINKFLMSMVIVLLIIVASEGQDILEVFDGQVMAFNSADTDRLVDNISDDFKWYYVTSDTLLLEVSGKDAFRKSMNQYFEMGFKPKSEIESYTIVGDKISFHEVVYFTDRNGMQKSTSAMGTYQIKNGKINRVWYFID